ncbi:CHAT domain-containing protein [Streptomyces sp. N2A]|uniref:CHAT domain-containing WD40 repeat protein n=1 Tax=Streptomyces sp. N2A TaxID=3073936 RepID=UPI0028706666|nr:CHAT domain-containing protein [Streptomyces sp. N2A]
MPAEFDFEVEMSEAPGGYRIEVQSPCGEDYAVAQLDAHELLSRLPALQATVLGSAVRSRGAGPELEVPVRQVGDELFNAVFQNTIKALYLSSSQKAKERDQRLRLVLRVRSPELAALPWELLHDPKVGGGYLCLRHPIVRHVEVLEPVSPLRVEPPLRILGVVALPGSLGALNAEAEQENLSAALRPLIDEGMVELHWARGQTKEHLYQALLDGCHVFHFIGHGRFDELRRQGMIVFADEAGREDPLHAEALGSLISVANPSPRLVVLNSCETGTANAQDLFSSTAAELEHTVPAVVAMQFPVTDKAAVLFSRAFYLALGANRPVDEAVRTGRIALRADKDDSLECFTPVLYQRSGDARLFDFPHPIKKPDPRKISREVNVPPGPPHGGGHPDPRPPPSPPPPPSPTPVGITPQSEIDTDRWVVSMAIHPRGQLIATGGRKLVRTWDVATGRVTSSHRVGGWSTMVNAIAFSADGGRLAAGTTDNIARIWDMATGSLALELTHGHFVNAVDFDFSQRYLVTGSADATARIWDLHTGNEVLSLRHPRAVKDVAFSPDRRLLLTACEDGNAYVWDTVTSEKKMWIPHRNFVLRVAFSPDGRRIATCSEDRTAQIRETDTWALLFCLEQPSGLRAVAFSPDSSLIATGSANGAVCVWRADTGQSLLHITHKRSVNAVAFYPDGRYLASAGEDKFVRNTRLPEATA